MSKKKVIYIDEDARFGGPQHRMILTAKNLTNRYDFLFLISNDDNKIFIGKLKYDSLKYKQIKITRLSKDFKTLVKYVIFFIPELISLMMLLKKYKPDVVQVNSTPHFKALIASSLLNLKTIWVLEDCNLPKPIIMTFKILNYIFQPKIIVTSNSVRDYYLKNFQFNENLRKIYAPVSTTIFNLKKFKKKIFDKKNINILMIANLTVVKGIEVFLEIVKKSPNNYCFTLCGGYPKTQKKYAYNLINKFKQFNKKKLSYIGHQNNVPKIISKCDFIICTSLSEAGPMTSLEGVCMKKPLITNNVGVIKDLFTNRVSVFAIRKNNPNLFLKAIDSLISQPIKRNKMINIAYNVAINQLNIKSISKKYDNFYKYLINN